jgi:A/G-specific adenine glycosylase
MPRDLVPSPARRAALRRRLLAWWDAGHRDLPWRFPQRGADPYRVWLAEVMLQQTRVETAIPYYRRFVDRWPSLAALAAADDAEVLAAWSGLGYYARCRNLLAAARVALARHGGLPGSLEALRALPGLGPYTAGAVASIAFALPAAAVDGNVARVLSRLFLVAGDPTSPGVKRRLEALAASLVDPRRPGDFNQSLMELGALTCLPRNPRCGACPLAGSCGARRTGRQAALPGKRARKRPVAMRVAVVRVERGGRLLLSRAPDDGLLGGMWGLPGVEVPAGSDPERALEAWSREELGAPLEVVREVATLIRVLTHRRIEFRIFEGRLGSGRLPGSVRMRFTTEGEASSLPASTAMHRVIEASGGWVFAPPGNRNTKKVARE